jgi:hypothetical protein
VCLRESTFDVVGVRLVLLFIVPSGFLRRRGGARRRRGGGGEGRERKNEAPSSARGLSIPFIRPLLTPP